MAIRRVKDNNVIYQSSYTAQSRTIASFFLDYDTFVTENQLMDVDFKTFKGILTDYFEHLANEVIECGKIVVLPAQCGEISIRRYVCNTRLLQFDYKSAKEQGAPAWHFNDHTNGFRYKFYWDKRRLRVKNCTKYQLSFVRANKRRLAAILKRRERDYLELDKN